MACSTMGEFGECTCLPLVDLLGPWCFLVFGIPFCVPPATLSLRVAMRYKYGLQGSLGKDVALSCFCCYCSWCQMAREIQAQKRLPVMQSVIFVQPSAVPSSQVFISNQHVVPGPQSMNIAPTLPGVTAEHHPMISYPAMASATASYDPPPDYNTQFSGQRARPNTQCSPRTSAPAALTDVDLSNHTPQDSSCIYALPMKS